MEMSQTGMYVTLAALWCIAGISVGYAATTVDFGDSTITGAAIYEPATNCICNHSLTSITQNGSFTNSVVSCLQMVCK
jgi:hypothetical protein